HFCWHPKLSVSGNCRICLVEVERMPKLAIACATQVMEGMVVHTASPKVINAREAVMEFLLINHPLDCPICDEAGECKLQDYAYAYSVGYSRFDEDKGHKPKRVELGPQVLLDMERCIMCSRCIRFCEEIAKKPQLTFTERGTHVELTTFPGEKLDNPYSMNTIDICPVGALTSIDFRFKARVWEMSSTETICPGCARGCNMYSWVRNNEILRQTPRYNPEVNDFWMCDQGRLGTFKHVNVPNRVKSPMVKKEGGLAEAGWDEAIAKAASELKTFKKSEIAVIGSAYDTNEDSYLLQKFAVEVLGTRNLDFDRHVIEGDQDDILIRADKTPNSLGAEKVGLKPREGGANFEGIIKGIKEGHIKALIIVDDNIAANPAIAEVLSRLEFLIVNFSFENETTRMADLLFPSSTFAEKNGTFTNFQGRVQRIRPSVATLDQDRSLDGFAMSRLDKFGSQFNDRWAKGSKRDARPTWKIVAGIASLMGAKFRYNTAEEVFNEIAATVDGFKGMTYRKIGNKGMTLKKKEQVSTPVTA
ncbi:MAG: molybdopterin-dependent oxidoreductase, partial [bacterium]